jgi:hypothetical protein
MDAVTLLRRLRHRRLAVAGALLLALVAGMLLAYRVAPGAPPWLESRQYEVGVASAAVLFDSESSLVSDLGDATVAASPANLAARAQLLANLLVSSPLKDQIAARAQILPQRLVARLSSADPRLKIQSAPAIGSTVRETDRAANVLNVALNYRVPIITFNARARSPQAAARLSNAAATELRRYVEAAGDRVPDARKLVVEPLGAASSSMQTRGPTRLSAALLALAVFVVSCAGILAVDAAVRPGSRELADGIGELPVDPPEHADDDDVQSPDAARRLKLREPSQPAKQGHLA